jgi:sporulation protein YlmC with PRC-barrel domain
MSDIELSINAVIDCTDGPVGKVIYILVNHITNEITHLVMREDMAPYMERLIPLNLVLRSSDDHIEINCTTAELDKLAPYNFVEFIDPQDFPSDPNTIFWPYVIPSGQSVPIQGKRIPPHELAFRRGAFVEASDGRAGKVDEFLVDPDTGHITHIVMREGHLWGTKEICIPISDVAHVGEEHVYLNLDKQGIDTLPEIPIQRHYFWKSR